MWFREKTIKGHKYILLRPERIELIKSIRRHIDEKPRFHVRIDGKNYEILEDISRIACNGICTLREIDTTERKVYYCDDSVIIAAICRFGNIYLCHMFGSSACPKEQVALPVLSRIDSRKYLKWHLIPHPGKLN